MYPHVCILLLNMYGDSSLSYVARVHSHEIFPYKNTSPFISSVDGHLSCLQFYVIASSAAVHIIAP